MGHPFHVLDGEIVILPLDHPFVPEGRFASLLIRDPTLANSLVTGFESLWCRSLKSLRDVKFYPRQVRGAGSRRKDQRENWTRSGKPTPGSSGPGPRTCWANLSPR